MYFLLFFLFLFNSQDTTRDDVPIVSWNFHQAGTPGTSGMLGHFSRQGIDNRAFRDDDDEDDVDDACDSLEEYEDDSEAETTPKFV